MISDANFRKIKSTISALFTFTNRIINIIRKNISLSLYYIKYGESLANIDKIMMIDTCEIEYWRITPRKEYEIIKGGDWDKKVLKFNETSKYCGIKLHFEKNIPWEETGIYSRSLKRIGQGEVVQNCNNREELIEYYNKDIEDLYRSIEAEGYKSKQELRLDRTKRADNEISVAIGRDGTFFFGPSGHHRLSIAKIQNIDEIPVKVVMRHSQWQKIRNEIHNASSIDELSADTKDKLGHPDLADVS
jgi:hypothetical protein